MTHCWHENGGIAPLERTCCHCGATQTQKYEPDKRHGPHQPFDMGRYLWPTSPHANSCAPKTEPVDA